jgi:cell division protein FtsX
VSLALTLIGLMAFIVPGLLVYARLALAEYRVVLAGDHPKDALKNSFEITRPFTLPIIACTAVLFGVYLSLQLVIEWLAASLSMTGFLPEIMNGLLSVVVMVFLTILLFRFYGLAADADLPSN